MTLMAFQYAVVRAVPRIDRGEMINIGVIMYCQQADFLRASMIIDDVRLRALDADGFRQTIALDINDDGEIAGHGYEFGPFDSQPLRWSNDGVATIVGVSMTARGTSINDRGELAVFENVGSEDGALVLFDRQGRQLAREPLGGIPFQPEFHVNARREAVWTVSIQGPISSFACRLRN